jgi:hypothetical protein
MREAELKPSSYVADPDVVACDLAGGKALLDLRSNTYFSLNAVGAFLWSQLQDGASVEDLTSALLSRYDVSEDVCGRDVEAIVQSMAAAKLIRPSHAAAG